MPKNVLSQCSAKEGGRFPCVRASARPSERRWLLLCASWWILMALLRSRAGKPRLPLVWIHDFTQTFAAGRAGRDISHPRTWCTMLVGLCRGCALWPSPEENVGAGAFQMAGLHPGASLPTGIVQEEPSVSSKTSCSARFRRATWQRVLWLRTCSGCGDGSGGAPRTHGTRGSPPPIDGERCIVSLPAGTAQAGGLTRLTGSRLPLRTSWFLRAEEFPSSWRWAPVQPTPRSPGAAARRPEQPGLPHAHHFRGGFGTCRGCRHQQSTREPVL